MNRLRAAALALATAAALALTGCTTGADDLGTPLAAATPTPTASEAAPAAPAASDCSPSAVTSYAPTGVTGSTRLAEIRGRGTLRVGVSADTLLMSARNPITGSIEGFDVDIAREVARAILGTDSIDYVVITSAQRLPALTGGDGAPQVDMVARTLTMTCDRWSSIAFSSEYYDAGLKVLVSDDPDGAPVTGIGDLDGEKVCAPSSTTTLSRLQNDYPQVEAVEAATHSQCLALFQAGEVDAIAGDDTILAGFVAQDPYAKVVGDALSSEPYGLGLPADDPDFVRFVNAALESIRSDGRWQSIYERWLGVLGEASPPAPVYGR
ncbi:glutamate ABC transporter substrate-binding protein [Rathayibacter sp. AY1B5]|uniref:glutamate ABC transporter substrate-binding protein n=1 Tax=Rathayibacter sp. AY1B5 TaxID=2080530 RepID=UPI000CE7346A|nr:glutamate ABC transporter substrate-binding protein [Rathayibacter sp. AY1B5]PPI20959.1 transporter substrate-binding protein [Rathayibacter sp. AY1B5]